VPVFWANGPKRLPVTLTGRSRNDRVPPKSQ
jgi:hypothetical protein